MPLRAKLGTLEGLDASTQALYRQEGEAFVLDVEAVEGLALVNAAEHEAAQAGLQGRLSKAEADLAERTRERDRALIEVAAESAMRDAGAIPKVVRPHVLANLGVVNGKVVAVDAQGKPRPSNIPGNVEPMNAAEVVELIAKDRDFAGAFYGNTSRASGTQGSGARRPLY
jgi:hypothetical protein